ncbi:hypothetical protein AO498_13685 [Algoriphagus sanaruensis]|uniref:Uncharacterized protein n=1 Tax=Algoriphagus sanaruensis TaxID=1727163 RepID=A0A142EQT9_9BACT|nr:hypothetical protein AO498_13685 [Algoriphagus sanaruensis]
MKKNVLIDEGDFSYTDEEKRPLGGAQSVFIGLVNGLSAIGCQVEVRNRCEVEFSSSFINWKRLNY